MNRRQFIRLFSQGLLGAGLMPALIEAAEPDDKRRLQFVFAQIKYRGGDWNPHPLSVTPLMEELMARTSVEAASARREVTLGDGDLFNYPFLYLAGRYEFDPFSQEEIETLRRFLTYGGFLLINDGPSTPVIYCQNDLGGAWERDQVGKWTNACTPGGEAQRKDAFHLGINIILYAMTENYKEDLIHVPFIRRRLTR